MSSSDVLLLSVTSLIVALRVYYLVWWLWNYPLTHGTGFFLGLEVPPGFYEGPGVRWLKRWRGVLLAEHSIEALVLVGILFSGHWDKLPLIAWGVVPFLSGLFGFQWWAQRTLGDGSATPSRVVVALESRRLGDYLSWPKEALVGLFLAGGWVLLLTHGDAQVRWRAPVLMTYVVLALFPAKINVVRFGFPLPAERTEEHHRWADACRRYSLRVLNVGCWFCVALLVTYALIHGWPVARNVIWFRRLLVGVALATWLVMVVIIIGGRKQLIAMGRGLRPACGWRGPFRGGTWMTFRGWSWGAAYLTGLILLLAFFRR
jgi:hypothetical protein